MILDEIVAAKRRAMAARARSLDAMWALAEGAPAPRDFAGALRVTPQGEVRFICEFKRRSPSAGEIRPGAEVAEVVAEYAGAGAAALSILTDAQFFGGALDDLAAARVASLPLLRKDFLLDEWDLVEARAAGADAVLLIVRLLSQPELRRLVTVAAQLDLAALVEAHSAHEIDAALQAGARVIGVNHRDLDTLHIDLGLSEGARARVGADVLLVAESGLKTRADIEAMAARGVDAVLVGESLLRATSPGDKLRELRGR